VHIHHNRGNMHICGPKLVVLTAEHHSNSRCASLIHQTPAFFCTLGLKKMGGLGLAISLAACNPQRPILHCLTCAKAQPRPCLTQNPCSLHIFIVCKLAESICANVTRSAVHNGMVHASRPLATSQWLCMSLKTDVERQWSCLGTCILQCVVAMGVSALCARTIITVVTISHERGARG
jgi:hypothetical protein